MRISFIGEDCDTAVVTRGVFRRREALLKWCETTPGSCSYVWRYESTERMCSYDMGVMLSRARTKEIERQQDEAEWIIVRVPAARSVLR